MPFRVVLGRDCAAMCRWPLPCAVDGRTTQFDDNALLFGQFLCFVRSFAMARPLAHPTELAVVLFGCFVVFKPIAFAFPTDLIAFAFPSGRRGVTVHFDQMKLVGGGFVGPCLQITHQYININGTRTTVLPQRVGGLSNVGNRAVAIIYSIGAS